jgi:hypothetical protein
MAGTGFFAIMSLRRGSRIIGNFALKFSPSGFGNSLTHWNLRPSNARWELFSERKENDGEREHVARQSRHVPGLSADAEVLLRFTRPRNGDNEFAVCSAMKFSVLLVELPPPSFFSIVMTSFLTGLSVRQALPPVGESIGVAAFLTSSGVRSMSSILEIFPPASLDCIIL